jgi:acyl dehydratase
VSAVITTDGLPRGGYLRALLRPRAGLHGDGVVPRIERLARGLSWGDLSAYRAACGLPEDGAVPLPYPQVLATPLHLALLADARFPLRPLGLVHVANRFEQRRPLDPATPFDLRAWTGGGARVRRGVEVTITTAVEQDGETPWVSTLTALVIHEGLADPHAPRVEDPPAPTPTRSSMWSVPADMGRRYAKIGGDHNPIHRYDWAAKAFGFERAIVHGMWSVARALSELELAPGPLISEVYFRRPVLLPSRARFRSGPTSEGEAFHLHTADERRLLLRGWARAIEPGACGDRTGPPAGSPVRGGCG